MEGLKEEKLASIPGGKQRERGLKRATSKDSGSFLKKSFHWEGNWRQPL